MSRRLTRTAAAALAALAFGLAVTACGGGGRSPEEQAAEIEALAQWQNDIGRWRTDMVASLNGISLLLSGAQSVDQLRRGDPKTTARLARYERTLARCSATIRRLGVPPAALAEVRGDALTACRSLEHGGRLVHDGVAAWQKGGGVGALNRATETLGNGQRGITHVRAELKAALVSARGSS